jgi:recombination protein RecA
MDIRRKGSIAEVEAGVKQQVGNYTIVKVIKNKVAPPYRQAEFVILFGEGISEAGNVLDLGCKFKLIDKSGSWFSYGSIRLGQGWLSTVRFIQNDQNLLKELNDKLREKLLSKPIDGSSVGSSVVEDELVAEVGEET